MKEGWIGDDYLVLFDEAEVSLATTRYGIAGVLPAHEVIGLRGWDDLIIRDARGGAHVVPSVPLSPQYVTPYVVPGNVPLKADARLKGKIKWYVTPVVFGGDPNPGPTSLGSRMNSMAN